MQHFNIFGGKQKRQSLRRRMFILWGILVFVLLVGYFTLFRPISSAYARVNKLKVLARATFAAAKTQDLDNLKKNIKKLRQETSEAKRELKPIFTYKFLPLIGFVFQDAENTLEASRYLLSAGEKAVLAIEPYADLIGFKKGSEFSQQPTEKRLETAILTIDKLVPKIDEIDADLEKARGYLEKINPERYPKKLGKTVVRERLNNIYEQVLGLVALMTDAKPLFKKLPYILGKDEERKYLILFLNDNELRPTGGFITAYSIFSIDKGQLRVKESGDIYDLDATISHPTAPEEILRYHQNVNRFYIRDSNLSPDYLESVKTFEKLLDRSSRRLDYDGIISVDTYVLVKTLEILGPTEAGGVWFKADSDPRCDCPQVIYELENIITRPTPYFREQRKSILGVLLYNLMQKSLGVSPSKYWGRLVQSYLTDLSEKHILVYLKDKDSQKAIESLGYGGRIKDFAGDYLHINNTNFAGAKSNMYMRYNIESVAEVKGGKLYRELTIEYRNIYPASDCNLERGGLCLNAPLRNWLRVYVPRGAKLVKFVGSEKQIRQYQDLGKQVFEGFLTVKPLGKAVVKISYELPLQTVVDGKYKLLIQKQPGVEEMSARVVFNQKEEELSLREDTVLTL